MVFTPSSLILAKKALCHDNGRKQIIVDIFFIKIHSQPPSEQDGVSGEDNLVVSSSQTKEKESRETAEVRSRIRCLLVKAWEVSFWWRTVQVVHILSPKNFGSQCHRQTQCHTVSSLSCCHNNSSQSVQSKEKKEKNERKITALLMGKLQVNERRSSQTFTAQDSLWSVDFWSNDSQKYQDDILFQYYQDDMLFLDKIAHHPALQVRIRLVCKWWKIAFC